jgi:hypothetical protein
VQAKESLTLAVHPYQPIKEIMTRFTPLADYLGKEIGQPVSVRVGSDYRDISCTSARTRRILPSWDQPPMSRWSPNTEKTDRLRELGVDYAQGYGIAVPAPIERMIPIGQRDSPAR